MQKQKALVSVIIPNFNRVESFQRAVESVIKQTYENFEIIVVDDGSEQSVRNINRRFLEEVKRRKNLEGDGKIIYLENERNFGVSYSRNKGIKEAKGDFIALLDSDDEWLEQKLELQVKFFSETDFRVVHTEEIWVRRGVRVNPMKKHKKEGGDIFFRSLELCLMSPSSIMLKKSIFDDYGYFDESLPVCEDYDLWLRITSKETVGFIEKPLIIKYGGHIDQLSRKYEAMDRWRVISLIKLLNSKQLSEIQEIEVKKMIEKKAKILYNGAVKRKKYDDAIIYKKWMEEYLI
ncbi:MAG TPA: glycosyltransferase family 2 protein [Exilispira sp.]|nr:glycosyltransferase family 2 protein [Exilispira sp.]